MCKTVAKKFAKEFVKELSAFFAALYEKEIFSYTETAAIAVWKIA